MEQIEANKGSFDILEQLAGATPKEEPKQQQQAEDPDWLVKLEKEWLSVHNDFLFTSF